MQNHATPLILDAILDLLIPARADGKVPSAGGLGVAAFVRAQGSGDPALTALLTRADACQKRGEPMDAALVQQLELEMPDAFATLLRLTYMGYYSQADVRAALGLSAAPVHPKGYDVASESEAFIADLVEPVKARGGMFREC
jgi:hypothetical protein